MEKSKDSRKASSLLRQRTRAITSPPPSRTTRVIVPSIPSSSCPDPGNHTGLSHPLLQFTNPNFRTAYTTMFSHPIHPSYHIVLGDVVAIGLHDKILGMINTVWWEKFVRIGVPIFHELFLEFLSTFTLNSSDHVDYTEKKVVFL